jgi:hypothetical protein
MFQHSPRAAVMTAVLVLGSMLALPPLARAQSPRDVLRDFGLLGTWATDCARPSDKDNFYAIYAGMPNGKVRRTYYNTPDRKTPYNVYTVSRATRLPADQLSYRQEGEDHDKIDVILLKDGNKYKIWSSVKDDGTVLVKDGKFPNSGDESTWQTKCND